MSEATLLEIWAEQTDPVKWAAMQIVKGGQDPNMTTGQAMDMIEAIIAKAIGLSQAKIIAERDRLATALHVAKAHPQYSYLTVPVGEFDDYADEGTWQRCLEAETPGSGDEVWRRKRT